MIRATSQIHACGRGFDDISLVANLQIPLAYRCSVRLWLRLKGAVASRSGARNGEIPPRYKPAIPTRMELLLRQRLWRPIVASCYDSVWRWPHICKVLNRGLLNGGLNSGDSLSCLNLTVSKKMADPIMGKTKQLEEAFGPSFPMTRLSHKSGDVHIPYRHLAGSHNHESV